MDCCYSISQFLLHDGDKEKGGEGDDGLVWRAIRRSDGIPCALKFFKYVYFFILINILITYIIRGEIMDINYSKEVPKEAAIMASLNHPHILKCFGWGHVFREELKAKKLEKLCCFSGGTLLFYFSLSFSLSFSLFLSLSLSLFLPLLSLSSSLDVGVFIVMEWLEGVTLEQKIMESSFGRNKRRLIFKQLLEAIVYP